MKGLFSVLAFCAVTTVIPFTTSKAIAGTVCAGDSALGCSTTVINHGTSSYSSSGPGTRSGTALAFGLGGAILGSFFPPVAVNMALGALVGGGGVYFLTGNVSASSGNKVREHVSYTPSAQISAPHVQPVYLTSVLDQEAVATRARPSVTDQNFSGLGRYADNQAHLRALESQRAFLIRERDKLKSIQGGMEELMKDNTKASGDLLEASASHGLDVLSGMTSAVSGVPGVPSDALKKIGKDIAIVQAAVSVRSFVSESDYREKNEKMKDAVGSLKDAVLEVSTILPESEAETINAGTNAVLKTFKIIDRHSDQTTRSANAADLEDGYAAISELVNAAGGVIPGASNVSGVMKVSFGATMMAKAEYAKHLLSEDREELHEAQGVNLKALAYYDQRLKQIQKEEVFYRQMNDMR